MPDLSPQTLTHAEQQAILRATRCNPRDHLIYSLALGTGLRLAEIVGLNVGDVYTPDGRPKNRVRLRPEIAKNGRAGDVFLPDRPPGQVPEVLAAQGREARGATARRSTILLAVPSPHLASPHPVRVPDLADEGRVRPTLPLSFLATHSRDGSLPAIEGPLPGAEVRTACIAADHHGLSLKVSRPFRTASLLFYR